MQYSVPQLTKFPLYAYLPHRGTTDCLLRVSEHCRTVRDRCIAHAKDDVPHDLFGGLQVSLDMEKAFDSVRRHIVYQALEVLQLPAWFYTITFGPP